MQMQELKFIDLLIKYFCIAFFGIASVLVPLKSHSQAPTLDWARGVGGTNLASGSSMAIDALGNVYTTGQFYGTTDFNPGTGTFNLTPTGGSDIFIFKLDAIGNFVWARQLGGTSNDEASSITTDAAGNLLITGYFSGTADFDPGAGTFSLTSTGGLDIFISKLDPSGNFLWAKQLGGASNDRGSSIKVNTSGNIITTGYFSVSGDFDPGPGNFIFNAPGGAENGFVSNLDSFGNFVWAKQFIGPFGGSSYPSSIAIDASGSLLTTGRFVGTADFDPGTGTFNLSPVGNSDVFISKLDASGNFLWARRFGGPIEDSGSSIAIDASSNVFTTGNFMGTCDFDPGAGTFNLTSVSSTDNFISKLDASGNFVWVKQVGGTGIEVGSSITIDGLGNVLSTGYFTGTTDFDPDAGTFNLSSPNNDIFISKLDASGSFMWAIQLGGTNDDKSQSIIIDALGNVLTTGSFRETVDFAPDAGIFNLIGVGTWDNAFVLKLKSQMPNFITQWNLATAGSGPTQLSFGTATSGTVNYTWQEISPGTASGSGSWSGSPLTITGLPTGATIRLQIAPTNFQRIIINTGTDRNRLTRVEQWGTTVWSSMQNAFRGCANLQVTATDLPDLSGLSDLSGMFSLCTTLNSPSNIGSWNTSVVTNMSALFSLANAFNQNISSWNTTAVTNMSGLFSNAAAFNQNIGTWNTASVTNMSSMFSGAIVFNQNIGSWNTAAVTDMNSMFYSAYAFNQNITGWNTASVTNMASMFGYAYNFNQNIGTWNTSAVTNMSRMFEDAFDFNQNIGTWNTSAVTNMRGLFIDAYAFNQNIGTWNTSAVTDMSRMFDFATAFNQNIGAWNTATVTNMSGMFADASAFNQNLGTWTLNPAVNMSNMLNNTGINCNNYSATLIGWSANPSTPNGRTLGATGRQYGTNAVADRTNLDVTKGWTITGDAPSGAVCSSFTITTQPVNFSACFGQTLTATFTTNASGTTNITYQWQQQQVDFTFGDITDGGAFSGATTSTLTINTALLGPGPAVYKCRINGDFASQQISNTASLVAIFPPPSPTTIGVNRCDTGSVTLTASGGSNGEYRWYNAATGGAALLGEVNNTYTTSVLSTTTTYYVVVSNGTCESTRTPVTATINSIPAKPTITSSITPSGNTLSVCSSNVLTLSAPAGFNTYAWSPSGNTQEIAASTSGNYSVIVTDAAGCSSVASDALIITVIPAPCSNQPPVIVAASESTEIEGKVLLDLVSLITDADSNIDIQSLKIKTQPTSGAKASITASGQLEVDYLGISFSGPDVLTIEVCDLLGDCTQQEIKIEVIGDLSIYNGISPNGDIYNEVWIIQNIESLPDTRENKVSLYNRWGDLVWETDNYDNKDRAFKGLNKNGNEVSSGTYFYKIKFSSGRKTETGYLSLKK